MSSNEEKLIADANFKGLPKPVITPPVVLPPSPLDLVPAQKSAVQNPPVAGTPVKVRIRESVEEEKDLKSGQAPLNTRLTAACIDVVVGISLTIGINLIVPTVLDGLAWIPASIYWVTRDSLPFLGGQSVGKKAMKIKVSKLDGKSIVGNWQAALVRNGVLLLPGFVLVELYLLLTRDDGADRGKRLGDEWAKTQVLMHQPLPPADETP